MLFSRYKDVEEKGLLPVNPYKLQFDGEFLSVFNSSKLDDTPGQWLEKVLFPKFIKMIKNYKELGHKTPTRSIGLIDRNDYYRLYEQLKVRYAPPLIELWTEVTDPLKYVYEDIAIACYLLVLWRKYSSKPQKFVDLGCGNGLLVYLLSAEGHHGTGIDVRKRKIWDVYPKCDTMTLKEQTVIPSDSNLFPEADWIIGNHSDELSPWIPVITARSSYRANFFLLPCCAYEFNGQKYQRSKSGQSVYENFLEYVTEVSRVCGFRIETDRLAIPSTKRSAVIGFGRVYEEGETETYSSRIKSFIDKRTSADGASDGWVSQFKPREAVERVTNCTKIDKTIAFDIVLKVFTELLTTKKRFVPEYPTWNVGGTLALNSVIQLLSYEEKRTLKEESGGLQTLLKNHSSVFQVQSGEVSIRVPVKFERGKNGPDSGKVKHFKTAECWFFKNHPNGCPLNDADCSYKHSPDVNLTK